MNKTYFENENFFDKIDSEEKAYVLGFFYADGCNSDLSKYGENRQNVISFTQLEQDADILNQIKAAMDCNRPYVKIVQNTNGKIKYSLRIVSRKLSQSLFNLGAILNKSLVLKFPDKSIFKSEDLIRHFIRGYFDGDGCIWNGKRKKMIVKDSKHEKGYREKIVHNVKFTFTGCISFIEPLQEYLVKFGIVKKKTKLNFSKANNLNTSTCDKVCTMEYSGRGQIKNLFKFMYDGSTIYGKRKYNKFQEIFCASDEKSSVETVLTEETAEMPIVNQAPNIGEGSSTIPEMGVELSDSKCTAPNE